MSTIQTLADRQFCMPPGADGVTLSVSVAAAAGDNWTNTAYETLLDADDSVDADMILTGICAPVVSNNAPHIIEFDVAVGDAGAEVVIATFRAYGDATIAGQNGSYLPTVIGIDAIPCGSRVAVRARAKNKGFAGSGPFIYRVSATYLKKPLTGTLLTTTSRLLCTPSSADYLTLHTPVTNWADGPPVAIRAASGPALIIVGTSWQGNNAGQEWEMDLIVNGGVITTLRSAAGGQDSYPNYQALHNPLNAVPAGAALAGRARSSVSDPTFYSIQLVGISYFNAPL